MSTKKNGKTDTNSLNLPASPNYSISPRPHRLPMDQQYPIPEDKRRFANETPRQASSIALQTQKTKFGAEKILDVNRYLLAEIEKSTGDMMNIMHRADGTEYKEKMEQVTDYIIEATAQQLISLMNINAVSILEEVASSPFFLLPEEPKKGFWERHFG